MRQPEPAHDDRSAHALRLRLYSGDLDRCSLPTFARGSARRGKVLVEAAVIGSSHWIHVRSGDCRLTEMLACQEAVGDCTPSVWRPGDRPVEQRTPEGARYRFESRISPWQRARERLDELRSLVTLARLLPEELGLAFEFPGPHRGIQTAETIVWAAAGAGGVLARTAHSYPPEGLVVFSATNIRFSNARTGSGRRGLVATH